MKIFLDTNVILDIYFPERGGMMEAAQIIDLNKNNDNARVYTSILSIANIAYTLRKRVGKQESVKCLKELFRAVNTLSMSDLCYLEALNSDNPAFEDALQISCADCALCDVIVTNDKKHFSAYTDIPVYTPSEFVENLQAAQ